MGAAVALVVLSVLLKGLPRIGGVVLLVGYAAYLYLLA